MNIYQHFRPEEREFIDQVINWKTMVEQNYSAKLTDFLDPREQHIVKVITGESGDVKYSFFGGSEGVERKRAFIYPDYLIPAKDDFQITLLNIEYPKKFVKIEHPQVLGTLMSLGLKRGKFGDILIKNDTIQFFSALEVSEYIKSNIESIGKAGVKLVEAPLETAVSVLDLWEELELTVSSLRLDTVISAIHHISRQKSLVLIKQGLVKVNWATIENSSFLCDEGDMVSVRGFGRVKILNLEGKTKKDKWRIKIGIQK
ncbi:RNA-binding protein [Bacillus sp. JJ1764]|uniref:YlmH family RNA-binding protein n=1 Tax=Bacillus sp. JJ1764 TaxID=3122964 RepID=UPI002FFFB4AA